MKVQLQTLPLLALSAATATNAEEQHQLRGQHRQLVFHEPECDDVGAAEGLQCYNLIKYKLEWPECVTDNLTVEQCKDLIRNQMLSAQHALVADPLTAIHLHLPEGLEDVVDSPPTQVVVDVVDDTEVGPKVVALKTTYYNRYEIPVNYAGEVQGYLVDGEIYYNVGNGETTPWIYYCDPDWFMYPTSAGGGGKPEICEQQTMEWGCRGSPDASHCENQVLRAMYENDISTKDKAGNYLTPWVRQISPTPFHKSGDDAYFQDTEDHLGFCAWQYNAASDKYEGVEVSTAEQLRPLNESKEEAKIMKKIIANSLEKGELINDDAVALVRKCHEHLRTLPDAAGICTELHYWTERYWPHSVPVRDLEIEIKPFLHMLDSELDRFMNMPDRLEYKIEIHGTDAAGTGVSQTPKLGHHYSHGDMMPVCVPGATA